MNWVVLKYSGDRWGINTQTNTVIREAKNDITNHRFCWLKAHFMPGTLESSQQPRSLALTTPRKASIVISINEPPSEAQGLLTGTAAGIHI